LSEVRSQREDCGAGRSGTQGSILAPCGAQTGQGALEELPEPSALPESCEDGREQFNASRPWRVKDRRDIMGDKGGKKDKEKDQKQKSEKQKEKAKVKQDKQPKKKL